MLTIFQAASRTMEPLRAQLAKAEKWGIGSLGGSWLGGAPKGQPIGAMASENPSGF